MVPGDTNACRTNSGNSIPAFSQRQGVVLRWPQPHHLLCVRHSSGSVSECCWKPWQGQVSSFPISCLCLYAMPQKKMVHLKGRKCTFWENLPFVSIALKCRDRKPISAWPKFNACSVFMNCCTISLTSFTLRRNIILSPVTSSAFNSTNYSSWDREKK